jgi:hypothetical protein
VEEGQLESIISEVEASRGPALVLLLQIRWRSFSWSPSSQDWRPGNVWLVSADFKVKGGWSNGVRGLRG